MNHRQANGHVFNQELFCGNGDCGVDWESHQAEPRICEYESGELGRKLNYGEPPPYRIQRKLNFHTAWKESGLSLRAFANSRGLTYGRARTNAEVAKHWLRGIKKYQDGLAEAAQ